MHDTDRKNTVSTKNQDAANRNSRPADGHLVIFGVQSTVGKESIAATYNPANEKSTTLAYFKYRSLAAYARIGKGETMIMGGCVDGNDSVEIFDYRKSLRRPLISMNVGRCDHGACAIGDTVVACGGRDKSWKPFNSCEVYFEKQWRLFPSMRDSRSGVAVVALPDRRVFAIGGYSGGNNDGILSSVEVCQLPIDLTSITTPDAFFWRSHASMREARHLHAAVIFQDSIIIAGGYKPNVGAISSVEMLPTTEENAQWISIHAASMNENRDVFTLVFTSREIFAIGNDICGQLLFHRNLHDQVGITIPYYFILVDI